MRRSLLSMRHGRKMKHIRLPLRDPRTVARDVPGILDILFPRLSGGLVAFLNKKAFSFSDVSAIPDDDVEASKLQRAMLFELSVARAEQILGGREPPDWDDCLRVAVDRQRLHYDARLPDSLEADDTRLAGWAAENLVKMLRSVRNQNPMDELDVAPRIPGFGWISSGVGDFSLGRLLIEVKHTARNFVASDFRQILMYWMLKYAAALEKDEDVWTHCMLINPRRNSGIIAKFDYLLGAASGGASRVEIYELMRSLVGDDLDRRI